MAGLPLNRQQSKATEEGKVGKLPKVERDSPEENKGKCVETCEGRIFFDVHIDKGCALRQEIDFSYNRLAE
ncbi:hypothetical protein RUM44_006058 [Polyplax serrata]|uniref:Uncharacterized protein n=1 Tax=Polyplax serrata TaxID=468196 RepID=A0ABR1AYT7_POLSC